MISPERPSRLKRAGIAALWGALFATLNALMRMWLGQTSLALLATNALITFVIWAVGWYFVMSIRR